MTPEAENIGVFCMPERGKEKKRLLVEKRRISEGREGAAEVPQVFQTTGGGSGVWSQKSQYSPRGGHSLI